MELQDDLLPKDIVAELNKYIVGQNDAKKAIAIAIRNRYRRMQLKEDELREEILPKNIIMIGPTGVGKTEIARRMAIILNAPFVKVEATKFTEIGYVGRNVETMVRDLVAESVRLVRKKKEEEVLQTAEKLAEEKIIFELLKKKKTLIKKFNLNEELEDVKNEFSLNKLLYEKLRKGELDDFYIEIDEPATLDAVSSIGMISATSDLEEINMNIKEMIDNLMTKRNKKRKLTVAKARKLFISQEIDKLLDMEEICEKALALAENGGIIFIDEIDKIISSGGESSGKGGPNVSREGVQRDILPIVEGTIVKTRYGTIKTDHILFIAAGAFSISKPSDLIPELQGRFPIRVELSSLKKDDFMKILNDTKNSLIKQYVALLKVENIKIEFMNSGIEKIAEFCDEVNKRNENIGARRLHTLLEKLLEDISFECDKYTGKTVKIDAKFVQKKLDKLIEDIDLSKYIL